MLLLILFCAGIFLWWIHGTSAANPTDTKKQDFVIAKGEGSMQIARELAAAHLIPDQFIFLLLVKLNGYENSVQAGDFQLSPSQTPQEILSALAKGTNDVWVTIPEGFRATEIAATLQQKIPSYHASWDAKLQTEEGYLFPDTYSFPKDATVDQIIQTMKNNFVQKYQEASKNPTVTLTQQNAVILASLVQREGKTNSDMKYIASVLENRVNLGMALQVDSTIQYIIGTSAQWWPQPTASDLTINSAYNTYKNPGLPPTPICNPGLAALTAVFHPANTDYLYYFTDGKGITHFAKTLEQQNANIAKYGE